MRTLRAVLALAVFAVPLTALAVNVRGRVDFASPRGVFPMNQALVELCYSPTNACLSYRTGYDGMYYFNAIPGPHYVRINRGVPHPVSFPNTVTFDISPLRGN